MIYRSVPINGFHDDYAFVVKGLLDLYEANFDPHWLELAEELQDIQDRLFWDTQDGGYFSTVKNSQIILRVKDGTLGRFCGNFSLVHLTPGHFNVRRRSSLRRVNETKPHSAVKIIVWKYL